MGPWFRIHSLAYHPVFFGTAMNSRFDDPDGKYGVLYVGESELAAFIETFGQKTGQRVVDEAMLKVRGISRLELKRPFRVVDLDGPNLARVGADAGLFAGDRAIARAWSAAFFAHPEKPDGLRYPCRHDNQEYSLAIFGGADREKVVRRRGTAKLGAHSNKKRVGSWLDHYGFALV